MGQESMKTAEQPYDMPGQSSSCRRQGACTTPTPSTLAASINRRVLSLPRSHRARPARGLGRAEGPQPIRAFRHARLRVITRQTGPPAGQVDIVRPGQYGDPEDGGAPSARTGDTVTVEGKGFWGFLVRVWGHVYPAASDDDDAARRDDYHAAGSDNDDGR